MIAGAQMKPRQIFLAVHRYDLKSITAAWTPKNFACSRPFATDAISAEPWPPAAKAAELPSKYFRKISKTGSPPGPS